MSPTSDDAGAWESMEALLEGSRSAFDAFVLRHWEEVMRFFWKRIAAQDAEDLTQGVFISVYRALREGKGPRDHHSENWRRYLFASARNQLIDYLRRKKARLEIDRLENLLGEEISQQRATAATGPGAEASAPLEAQELQQAIRDCMGQLEAVQRSICWLLFVDGHSKRDLARSMAMPESTLRASLVKVLKTLRRCLEGKGMAPTIGWGTEEVHGRRAR